jgi:TetR/AcrR family transcriptional repressor of mexCD-oprJ operon
MSEPAVDHRRATAMRNGAAILDATERLLERRTTLSMAAVAAEAGVSRPTLYAHFKSLSQVVEAAVDRAVHASLAAVEEAEPAVGPADAALDRMITIAWGRLAQEDALARAAAEHLPTERVHRAHAPLMTYTRALVERGRRDGVFRTDLPAEWLVTTFYALVHGADDHARAHGVERGETLALLTTTVREVFAAR